MRLQKPHTNLEVVLEEMLQPPAPEPVSITGIVVGRLVAFTPQTGARVDFSCNPANIPQVARSTVPLNRSVEGKQVTLMFEGGDPAKPIITGVILDLLESLTESELLSVQGGSLVLQTDRETISLRAEEQIVLECGKSSIMLTKAGKVLIKGEYVLSRSAGANKIKGGSVQIN